MINLFRVRPRRFNVGNATIDLAVSRMLREVFGDRVNLIPVPAIESDEEGSLSGLTARTIREMNLYGHGVVLGGGNIYENGQLDLDTHALGRLAPPLLLCSLSHGRIFDRRGRLTERTDSMPDERIVALHQRAVGSLARDTATLQHLHGLGLRQAVLGGCPTLFLDHLAPAPAPLPTEQGTLISIRNPSLMSIPYERQARLHGDVRALINALEDEGLGPVRLLCHDRRDLLFAASFDVDYVLPDDVASYFELLRRAALVVSFRLHAFLPCVSFGTPAVNISYDERSLSLVRTVGLGSWDINLIEEDDIVAAVIGRVRRLPELNELVDAARPVWEEQRVTTSRVVDAFAEHVFAYAAGGAPVAA